MALQQWERFKGITDFRRDNLAQNIKYGVLSWLKWSSLQIGAFQNVNLSNPSGMYGGNFSRLRMVSDPNYTDGQVWEGFRPDWVWETGVEYGISPAICSGVYVNNNFYPTASTTGNYKHYVDYPNGRIVFDSPISTSGVVETNYAFRTLSFVDGNLPWFQDLLFKSYDIYKDDFLAVGSGNYDRLSQTRRQMPVVGITFANRNYTGFELGGGQIVYQDILLYVCAENDEECNQISDILSNQNDKSIWIPNKALMKEHGDYPPDIDYRGMTVSNPKIYPSLVSPTGEGGYQWRKIKFSNSVAQFMQPVNGWLYRSVIKTTLDIIMGDI